MASPKEVNTLARIRSFLHSHLLFLVSRSRREGPGLGTRPRARNTSQRAPTRKTHEFGRPREQCGHVRLVGRVSACRRDWGRDEITVRVNVVSTMLLAMLLLPKLRETSIRHGKETVCTFTGSCVHFTAEFPERGAGDIFGELADEKKARMGDRSVARRQQSVFFLLPPPSDVLAEPPPRRYNVTKLIELLLARQLARHVTASPQPGRIVVSIVNPGAVRTDILREAGFLFRLYLKFLYFVLMRTAEEGSRTLVSAAWGWPGDAWTVP